MKTIFVFILMVGIMVISSWGQTQVDLYLSAGQFGVYKSVPHPGGETVWKNKGSSYGGMRAYSCCYHPSDFDILHERVIEFPFHNYQYFEVPESDEELLKFKLTPLPPSVEQGHVESNYILVE